MGVCDYLFLVGVVLVGVGDVHGSGGGVLSGVVGRGIGGSVDWSGGVVVADKWLVLVGVGDVRRSGGEVLSIGWGSWEGRW